MIESSNGDGCGLQSLLALSQKPQDADPAPALPSRQSFAPSRVFHPAVGTELRFGNAIYRVCEHPVAKGQTFVQEGRAGKVFQLTNGTQKMALKVFHQPLRDPGLVEVSEALRGLAGIPGLSVCDFEVLHSRNYPDLVSQFPDLVYAMLMPWIEGPTWVEIVMSGQEIPPERCLTLALALTDSMVLMEQRKAAHTDLSGGNLIIPGLKQGVGGYPIALVDVEAFYTSQRRAPDLTPAGSPGYSHFLSGAPNYWGAKADRFAGALLLSEILAWWDPAIREASAGETFFEPHSTQNDRGRAALMEQSLQSRWGDNLADCFRRAFESPSLDLCPVFEEWRVALLDAGRYQAPKVSTTEAARAKAQVQAQMDRARKLYEQRRFDEALRLYEEVLLEPALASGLKTELPMIIEDLKKEMEVRRREERPQQPSYIIPEQTPISPVPVSGAPSIPKPKKSRKVAFWGLGIASTLALTLSLAVHSSREPSPTPVPPAPVGEVSFDLDPNPLNLVVDGVPFSEPLQQGVVVKLGPGEHKLNFEADQRRSQEKKISVEAGQKQIVVAHLDVLPGNISIHTSPAGASLYLDGQVSFQKTDAKLTDVKPGKYQIRLVKTGFRDLEKTVEVSAGQNLEVSYTLTAKPKPLPSPKPSESVKTKVHREMVHYEPVYRTRPDRVIHTPTARRPQGKTHE